MKRTAWALTTLLLVLTLSCTAGAQRRLVLDDFEDTWFNFSPYHDDIGSSLTMSKAEGYSGQGLYFAFNIVEDGWAGAWYSLANRNLSAYEGGTLSFWLKGDGSKSRFWVTLADAELDIFVYEIVVEGSGWQQIVIPLSEFQFLRTRGENTDGLLTLRNMDSLAIDFLPLSVGEVIFDDIVLIAAQ